MATKQPTSHYDPTQRGRCVKAKKGDGFMGKIDQSNAICLLWVSCPHCRKKASFKKVEAEYEVVMVNGLRCVRRRKEG